jgi:hypothetical protein
MICEDSKRRKLNRRVYGFIDIAKAYDSVDRELMFKVIDERIQEAGEKANALKDVATISKLLELQQVLTPLKNMYEGHVLKNGDEEFETTNGVIQGSVNSPWLFSIYLEHFLFQEPTIKRLCEEKKILAFADDMVIMSESWSEYRYVCK